MVARKTPSFFSPVPSALAKAGGRSRLAKANAPALASNETQWMEVVALASTSDSKTKNGRVGDGGGTGQHETQLNEELQSEQQGCCGKHERDEDKEWQAEWMVAVGVASGKHMKIKNGKLGALWWQAQYVTPQEPSGSLEEPVEALLSLQVASSASSSEVLPPFHLGSAGCRQAPE